MKDGPGAHPGCAGDGRSSSVLTVFTFVFVVLQCRHVVLTTFPFSMICFWGGGGGGVGGGGGGQRGLWWMRS